MNDPRLRKWAQLITQYSAPVHPGHEVVIRGTPLAIPLILELYRAVLEQGGFPHLRVEPGELQEILFRYAPDEILDSVPDLMRMEMERLDVIISIRSENNTRALSNVAPDKEIRLQRARQPMMEEFFQRAAVGEAFWCLTQFPTPAYAQDAEMGLLEYREFLLQSCFLNEADPVARWRQLRDRQQLLADHLNQAREIRLKGPGTDLRLGIAGRKWINDHGKENLPGGEVFSGPVEDQVEGQIRFDFPAVYQGREVRGLQLWFEQGRVVRAQAEHNQGFFEEMIDTDEGARYVGEIAFGTNYNVQRFMRNTLFDEKIGGTVHLALGRSYPETGGQNMSAIHWDIVCDLRRDGEVYVDGELFQKDGRFRLLEDGIV
ncbi:MAG: aminopeptidase [Chloroflexia bacterium]|nr:aminopeptidase [Chloroflexia bacterium]